MRRFFQKLFRSPRRPYGLIFCILVVFGAFFLYLRPTFAVEFSPTGIANGLIEGITSISLSVAKVFLGLTIAGLRIFIQLAAYNDYIDSPPVVVGWYMVRDLANMFFVVALLAIAFGTMLGLEQYEWKKSLVKLVMAAILINFSRLLIGLIIDASHIFTITFLDAIQGVAAGNLIGMLHLDKVFNLATGGLPPNDDLRLDLLGAAVMSVIFSLVAMLTIGAYLIMMALRVVVLWVLIILSPLAFVFSAIPQTKGYADEFWGEVSKNIIVAPIMVFFLWLAFATLGTGQINNHIGIKTGGIGSEDVIKTLSLPSNSSGSVSLLELSTWENMSGFIIAIVFLLVGLDRVQKTGATGSSFAGSVAEFGKKALVVGSGFAAARWAASKTLSAAGDAASFVGGNALKYGGLGLYKGVEAGLFKASDGKININPEVMGNYFKRQVAGYKSWVAKGPEKELEEDWEKVAPENRGQVVSTNAQGHRTLSNGITIDAEGYKLDASGNRIQKKGDDGKGRWKYKRDREEVFEKAGENDVADAEGYKLDAAGQRIQMKDEKTGDLKFIEKGYLFKKDSGRNLLQRRYAALISSRKTLEKTENQFKNREELVDKRTTGKPEYFFQSFENDGRDIDAVDRVEQGELKGEQARSAAKTKEYHTAGEELVIKSHRFKDGKFDDAGGKKTVAEQIADHELQSERTQQFLDTVLSEAKTRSTGKNKDIVQAKVFGKLQLEASDAKRGQLEGQQTTYLAQKSLAAQKAIQDAIAGERGSHEEAEKLELEKKRQETSYLQSAAGQHELDEEAKLKAELGLEEKKIERMATGAEAAFSLSAAGGQTSIETKEEELQTSLYKNVLSAEEERAKSGARLNLSSVAEREQLEKMKAELESERTKGIESEQRQKVATTTGKAVLTETEEQRILSGKAEGLTKEQIEEAKLEATRRRDIEVRESKEAEIRTNATAEEVKDLEEAAKRKATSSQTDAVLRGKEAALRAGTESAETKEIESRAAQLASVTQASYLERTKAAEARSGLADTEVKVAEEAARREASLAEPDVSIATREAEIRLKAEETLKKEREERGRRAAMVNQAQTVRQTKESEIRTSAETEEQKELEEGAKREAVKMQRQSILRSSRAKLRTTAQSAAIKNLEERAKSIASKLEKAALDMAKEQEILASSFSEISKRLENQARLRLVVDNSDSSAYKSFVKSQSLNKIIQDQVGSREKAVVNADLQKRMEAALAVEKKAQLLQRSGDRSGANTLRSRSHVWQYAAAKALEEKTSVGYNQNHNAILSDVEQEVVHNARGIQTPTNALTQAIEKYTKDYAEMDYDMFVGNLETNLKTMLQKRADQAVGLGSGVTSDDKAAMAGLLAHGQKNAWLDDAVWKYMGGDLRSEIQSSLGWKDTEFDNKKINDIMSIFAAGGDLKFSAIHTKIADVMDAAKEHLGIGVDKFIDKISQGFRTGFTVQEQQELNSKLGFNIGNVLPDDDVNYYMNELEDNQAQLQFITNLRDKAAVSSHPENGGHGQFVTLSNGRTMFVLTGQRIARDSVIGEVKKTQVGNRASMQTHAIANIDEATGFVTRVREDDARDVRSGINTSNDYRGTNARFELHTGGLASKEDKTEYKSKVEADNGSFLVTGKKADGTFSDRHKWLQTFDQTKQQYIDIDNVYSSGGNVNGISTVEEAKLQATSDNIVNEIFAKRIAANPNDFLITMAHLSGGVTETDALSQGKMNIKVLLKGKEKHITNINELIRLYNSGEFSNGAAPIRQLASYSKQSGQSQGSPTPPTTPNQATGTNP